MSDALKRRCLHLYIDYPERNLELDIVKLKLPMIDDRLAEQLVDAVRGIRSLDMKKSLVFPKHWIGQSRLSPFRLKIFLLIF